MNKQNLLAIHNLLNILSGNIQDECALKELDSALWKQMVEISIEHHVNNLLYKRLKDTELANYLAPNLTETLHFLYVKNTAKNLFSLQRLREILLSLQKKGIPVLILKGVHLIEDVWEEVGLRNITDCDLLFRKADFERAINHLLQKGYLDTCPQIDPHWHIEDDSIPVDLEGVWQRAESFDMQGVNALGLCTEDLILHLCLHCGYHHLFQFIGLRTLLDIQQILKIKTINFSALKDRARLWGMEKLLLLCLNLKKQLLDSNFLSFYIEENERKDETVEKWAVDQIFFRKDNIERISPFFLKLFSKETPINYKIKCMKRLLFPPYEEVVHKYSDSCLSGKYIYIKRFLQKSVYYMGVGLKILVNQESKKRALEIKQLYKHKKRLLD